MAGRLIVPQASQTMDRFKYEVARNLNIQQPQNGYWGEVSSRDCGSIGGQMVKMMIQQYEQGLAGTSGTGITSGTVRTSR